MLRTPDEIELLRESGRINAIAMRIAAELIRPGITTNTIACEVESYITSKGGKPAFKGYNGYPAPVCISIDNEVVHGIPSNERVLEEGNIVSIDLGTEKNGYLGDMARTFPVGEISEEDLRLIHVTRESFYKGMEKARVGGKLGDISHAVQEYVELHGFSIVRALAGHGIGRELHEDPQIPNYGKAGSGVKLKSGMVFAVEPMVNAGSYEVEMLSDGWTWITSDRKKSAHYENTFVITANGPEILTTNGIEIS